MNSASRDAPGGDRAQAQQQSEKNAYQGNAKNSSDANQSKAAFSSVVEAALAYAAQGWQVFPLQFDGPTKKSFKSKEHSNGRNWGKTTNSDEIRLDYQRWPQAGVGIATGGDSGIFVVESDTLAGHGVDGIAALKAAKHGPLPPTRTAISPSGGPHFYFKHPGGDLKIKNSASEIAPGVDVRGDGGMVVAPPSVRPEKGAYRWLTDPDAPIADPPSWLVELVKDKPGTRTSAAPESDPAIVAAALAVIPNNDLDWESWNRIGMATWRATGGSTEGFVAFDKWSQKSKKYDARYTLKKWDGYFSSPPHSIGAGTIFHLANEADPGWTVRYDAELDARREEAARNSDRMWAEFNGGEAPRSEEPPPQPDPQPQHEPPPHAEQSHETSDNRAEPKEEPPPHAEQPHDNRAESKADGRRRQLLLSSAEFVKGFVPPDYLIDGMLLRKNVYALTGRTGDGKTAVALRFTVHVALGLPLAERSVEKGRVLFFAARTPMTCARAGSSCARRCRSTQPSSTCSS